MMSLKLQPGHIDRYTSRTEQLASGEADPWNNEYEVVFRHDEVYFADIEVGKLKKTGGRWDFTLDTSDPAANRVDQDSQDAGMVRGSDPIFGGFSTRKVNSKRDPHDNRYQRMVYQSGGGYDTRHLEKFRKVLEDKLGEFFEWGRIGQGSIVITDGSNEHAFPVIATKDQTGVGTVHTYSGRQPYVQGLYLTPDIRRERSVVRGLEMAETLRATLERSISDLRGSSISQFRTSELALDSFRVPALASHYVDRDQPGVLGPNERIKSESSPHRLIVDDLDFWETLGRRLMEIVAEITGGEMDPQSILFVKEWADKPPHIRVLLESGLRRYYPISIY